MSEVCVRVAVRIRPILPRETLHRHQVCLRVVPGSPQLQLGSDRLFSFDHVFGPMASQDEVYECCVQQLVESVAEGYNATVFCYGQTGSGKTYTLGGRNPDEEGGIIDRAAHDLFLLVENKRKSDDATDITVRASYMELYKDELRDLLELPTIHKVLHIRDDQRGNTVVVGAKEVVVSTAEQLFSVLETGNALRRTAGTGMNEHSSRSHAILTLHVTLSCPSNRNSLMTSVRSSKLCLVDLAGSERATKTGNTGTRLQESSHINTDLLALGNVIRSLSDPNRNKRGHLRIPYRNSKLTRLLRDSLGGNAHTLMVACVSPSHRFVAETLSVLHFASKARHIRNCPGPISLETEITSDDTDWHPNEIRLRELEYELQTLRELLKEKEKEVELGKQTNNEKGDVQQSSLVDISESGKVKIEEDRLSYRLLAQEAAVLLTEISGSCSVLSLRQRVRNWQERLTAVTHSHDNANDCAEMTEVQSELDKLQEPFHREKQLSEKKDAEMRLALRQLEKLVQERIAYLKALDEERQRSRIQTEQLVTQQIVIDRLRSDLMTFGRKSSGTKVAANVVECSEKRPHSVPLLRRSSCTRRPLRKIHSSPPTYSLERVMAAFKMRGNLLLAEVDEKEELFCPFIKQWADSKNGDQVIVEDDENVDSRMSERGFRRSLNRTWTSQQKKSSQKAQNTEEDQTRHPVIQQPSEAPGTMDDQPQLNQSNKAKVHVGVIQRRIQDLSVNMRLKEELIKELDKTEKQIEAMNQQGSHPIDDRETNLLARLSMQSQQIRREMYHSLQHMMLQRAQLQSSLSQQRQTSDASKENHTDWECEKYTHESPQKEESKEKLPERCWLEEEEDQVLQKRGELQQLEEELSKREEVLQRREACLQQKSKLEIKKLHSSQVLSLDLLHVSMQLESLEQQLQKGVEGVTLEELEKERDALKKKRDNLNDQLRDNRVLTTEEEHHLHQLEEDIEALDAAVEFKNNSISEKERNLSVSETSLHQSQSVEPAELSGVKRKLRKLSQYEAYDLLIRYFNKVICLRETVHHLRLRCEELELHEREQETAVRDMEIALRRMTLDTDRRFTEQHRDHLNTVQLLLQKVTEGVSEEAQQALQKRLQELENDVFYYKSFSRQLKKRLREVLKDAPDPQSQSAQIQEHSHMLSKHGCKNSSRPHSEEAPTKTHVATTYAKIQAEQGDWNAHQNKHAQHTQPRVSCTTFGRTKTAEGSQIRSESQENKAGGNLGGSAPKTLVRFSRSQLRQILPPDLQFTSSTTGRQQSAVNLSTDALSEDSIEVSKDL